MLTFVEDAKFTAAADRLLSEAELFELMRRLADSPNAGDVIPGSGGCRKLRFPAKGKGSRGGARIIYFYRRGAEQIVLLELYTKDKKKNLSAVEITALWRKAKS